MLGYTRLFIYLICEFKDIIPWPSVQVDQVVSELGQGDAILVFGNGCERISVRKRHTFQARFTPDLKEIRIPEMKQTSEALVKALQKLPECKMSAKSKWYVFKKINRLRLEVAERDKQINQLENQLQIASRLKLDDDHHVLYVACYYYDGQNHQLDEFISNEFALYVPDISEADLDIILGF